MSIVIIGETIPGSDEGGEAPSIEVSKVDGKVCLWIVDNEVSASAALALSPEAWAKVLEAAK